MSGYIKSIIDTLKNSIVYIVFCVIFFVIGIVLSFFCHKFEGLMFYLNVLERYMFIFDPTMHVSSYFLSKVLASLGICILIFLCGFSIATIPVHFVIFLYQGFVIGAVCPYFFSAYYISGIIVFAFALVPSMLLRFLANACYSTLCMNFKKKNNLCNNNRFSALLLMILFVFMLYIIAVLWEIIFIGFIIKPFNIFF